MRSFIIGGGVVVTAAFLVGACKDKPTAKNKPVVVDASPTVATTPEVAVTLPHRRKFEILSPGAEPRAILRYTPSNETVAAVTTVDMLSRELGPKAVWTPDVRVVIAEPWSFRVEQGRIVGTAGALLAPKASAESQPVIDAVTAHWNDTLANRSYEASLDPQGTISGVKFQDDATASRSETLFAIDEVGQRWAGMVIPLPDAAVGVGAEWQTETVMRISSVPCIERVHYKLLSNTDNVWKFEVRNERSIQQAKVRFGNVDGEIVGQVRRVKGTWEVRPNSAWPVGVDATLELQNHQRYLDPETQQAIEKITQDFGVMRVAPGTEATVNPKPPKRPLL